MGALQEVLPKVSDKMAVAASPSACGPLSFGCLLSQTGICVPRGHVKVHTQIQGHAVVVKCLAHKYRHGSARQARHTCQGMAVRAQRSKAAVDIRLRQICWSHAIGNAKKKLKGNQCRELGA